MVSCAQPWCFNPATHLELMGPYTEALCEEHCTHASNEQRIPITTK